MNDAQYCQHHCPQHILCPVAGADGCMIGSAGLQNPGAPLCCEVDNHNVYLNMVRAIYDCGENEDRPATADFRADLGALLQSIVIPLGPSMFQNHRLSIDNRMNGIEGMDAIQPNFSQQQEDDLFRLIGITLDAQGTTIDVVATTQDISRQPVARRMHERYIFSIPNAHANNHELLTLVGTLTALFVNATTAHEFFSL
ncbi:unnamed protein product, partial [Ectocarpus sp. 6 AP-2014]